MTDDNFLAEKLFKVEAVDTSSIEIGKTYKFSGRITEFIDDEPPLPRVRINTNIYATLQGVDKEAIEYLKEKIHVTAIFHCRVIDIIEDNSLETECMAIGMGILQDDKS